MATIYLSSTKVDLEDCRTAVTEALRREGHLVKDSYEAAAQPLVASCLADAASADIYVGLFAWRYGYCPPGQPQGQARSITELEYRAARDATRPCLIFLAEKQGWSLDKVELDALARIEALRDELANGSQVRPMLFSDAADLALKVTQAVRTQVREPQAGAGAPGGEDAMVYLAPAPERGHGVIGRDRLLAALKAKLLVGEDQTLIFLPGVGKTTVVLTLAQDRDFIRAHFDGLLWADLGRQPVLAEVLRKWAEALGISHDVTLSLSSVEDWMKAVRGAIGERRMLVVLDDAYQEDTVREFMELCPRCVFIVTSRLNELAGSLEWGSTEVEELDEASSLALLDEIAPRAVDLDEAAALKLVQAVQGLPLALVLVGMHLKRESVGKDPDPGRIRRAFQAMGQAGERLKQKYRKAGNKEERSLEDIIEVSFDALESEAARDAFRKLSIFRPKPNPFTPELAAQVCAADTHLLEEISDAGLIEPYRGGYTMHRVIAEYARTKLSPEESVQLHRKAIAYYAEQLETSIDQETGAYLSWYRYERADWQAMKDAWLYHLAHCDDMAAGLIAFLRVYFDAFWWWGYYQRFPFCERLIREWRQRELDPWVREGLDLVQGFQDAYPAGYDKAAGRAWGQVDAALARLRGLLGLEGATAAIQGEDARRVRGFLDFFLAEACAYGRADPSAALALYRSAHDLFEEDEGSGWVAAWIWFYVAQYLLEQADPAQARQYCLDSLTGADEAQPLEKRDSELFANDYRLLGDLALGADDLDAAAAHYRRAAFYAYAFQGVPEPADSYTMAFYREITQRIAAQALHLYRASRPRGRALCERLREFWAPGWAPDPATAPAELEAALASGDAVALAACLFPPGLEEQELLEHAVDFQKRVLSAIGPLQARLGEPAARP